MLKVLVVDDSSTQRVALTTMLQEMGHQTLVAANGQEGVQCFREQRPGLVLMDLIMPVLDGCEAARQMRASVEEWVPIIFLTARQEDQDLVRAIEAGGDDYLIKPVSFVVLSAKIRAMCRIEEMRQKLVAVSQELVSANRELERISRQDGLTGLANRRYFDFTLGAELSRARRLKHTVSLLLCDVDHFKLYNDTYGHLAGDDCLRSVAGALKTVSRRPSDLPARYGGEEFALILPDTTLEGAVTLGQVVRNAVRDLHIPHEGSMTAPHLTMSVGIAVCRPGNNVTPEQLIADADRALYQAKQLGRDRAEVAQQIPEPSLTKSP